MDELIENTNPCGDVINNAQVGLIAFDRNFLVKWLNPALLFITGLQVASFSNLHEYKIFVPLSYLSGQNELLITAPHINPGQNNIKLFQIFIEKRTALSQIHISHIPSSIN